MDEGLIQSIAWQLFAGLEHLHSHNLVHRDVKPANILCMDQRQIKLTDFGLAGEHCGTKLGSRPGTVNYMAPELFVLDNDGHALYNYKVFLPLSGALQKL